MISEDDIQYQDHKIKHKNFTKKCLSFALNAISCVALGYPKTKDYLINAASKIRKLRDESSSPQYRNGKPNDFWVYDVIHINYFFAH